MCLKLVRPTYEYAEQVMRPCISIMEMNKMTVELGKERDIDNWMCLVDKVKKSFPGLEFAEALAEHRNTVLEFMSRDSAICTKLDDLIVGTLLFSKEDNIL